ncbi:recombinase family protein [Actinoallomurus acaciae]|uniref:Recombinase family protein n=1 Tax=Actinoallomurus acaciae TaxID=502577 RepID=A0ABV5YDG0_9ACTN
MSAEDWSPSDLPAVSYIRVAPTTTDEAAHEVERQRAQIALATDRLGLRMADEFVDVGYSGLSMDRPDLRRLLDHVAAHRVGYCVVATRDRLSEDPEHMADIDETLDDALVAIVIAADHTGPEQDEG